MDIFGKSTSHNEDIHRVFHEYEFSRGHIIEIFG